MSWPCSVCCLDSAPMWASQVESDCCNKVWLLQHTGLWLLPQLLPGWAKGQRKEVGNRTSSPLCISDFEGQTARLPLLLQRPQTIASGPLPAFPLHTSPLRNVSDYQDSSLVSYSPGDFCQTFQDIRNLWFPPGLAVASFVFEDPGSLSVVDK